MSNLHKISNAIVFDDKVNLLSQQEELEHSDRYEFQYLKTIQNFFLNNTIPFSIISQIGDSAIEAIEKIGSSPRPDLVVLDLDLNSNGEVDSTDISLLTLMLKELKSSFGDFIILIYSSQAASWQEVKEDILMNEKDLESLLSEENVIVVEKKAEADANFNENLSAEIIRKRELYFGRQLKIVNNLFRVMWNKEALMVLFLLLTLILIIRLSFDGLANWLFVGSSLTLLAIAFSFLLKNSKSIDK